MVGLFAFEIGQFEVAPVVQSRSFGSGTGRQTPPEKSEPTVRAGRERAPGLAEERKRTKVSLIFPTRPSTKEARLGKYSDAKWPDPTASEGLGGSEREADQALSKKSLRNSDL
jgi:hypothetical protein